MSVNRERGKLQSLVPGHFWVNTPVSDPRFFLGGEYLLVLSLTMSQVLSCVCVWEEGGVPEAGQGYPSSPSQDRVNPLGQDRVTPLADRRVSPCYAAGRMFLVVMQENFIVIGV